MYINICIYMYVYIYVLYSKIIVDGLLKATFWLLRPSVPWCLTKQTQGLEKDLQKNRYWSSEILTKNTQPPKHPQLIIPYISGCGRVNAGKFLEPARLQHHTPWPQGLFKQSLMDQARFQPFPNNYIIISNGIIDESTSKNVLDQLSKGIRKIHGPCKVMPPKLCLLVYTPN